MEKFTWNDVSIEVADLPIESLHILAQRGFTHVVGNEIAAKVTAYRAKNMRASDSEVTTFANAARKVKIAAMLNGTMTVRESSGPRLDGIERIMRELAIKGLRELAARKKAALPKESAALLALVVKYTAKNEVTLREQAQDQLDALAELNDASDDWLDDALTA